MDGVWIYPSRAEVIDGKFIISSKGGESTVDIVAIVELEKSIITWFVATTTPCIVPFPCTCIHKGPLIAEM